MTKKTTTARWILPLLFAVALAPSTASAPPDADAADGEDPSGSTDGLVWRLHPVHHLDLHAAGLLVEQMTPEMLMDREYQMRRELVPGDRGPVKGYLRVLTEPAYHERIAETLREHDRPAGTHRFQVFLLLAGAREASPDLPPGAAAALDDLQGLMRFAGYERIDAAIFRTSHAAEVALRSPYVLEFGVKSGSAGGDLLEIDRFVLRSVVGDHSERHLGTTFSMEVGETVVVGTSRSSDEREALVVLLTALE
jgi:hypothetical protein